MINQSITLITWQVLENDYFSRYFHKEEIYSKLAGEFNR